MFTPLQVLLVCLWVAFFRFQATSLGLFSYCPHILSGFMVGTIMGDARMGMYIGGTLTLMSLGVGGFGGSSVPDYALGTVLGTLFACTGSGMETGLTVAIPVAMLGTYLDVANKTLGSFFAHKAMACNERMDFKGQERWTVAAEIPRVLLYVTPVFLAMTVGAGVIEDILEVIPSFVTTGMAVAGGILPAMGFAILMKYMPTKEYGVYLILGFVLSAWVGLPILAIAGLGFICAYEKYQIMLAEGKTAVMGKAAEGAAKGGEVFASNAKAQEVFSKKKEE